MWMIPYKKKKLQFILDDSNSERKKSDHYGTWKQ